MIVEYRCYEDRYVGVEVVADVNSVVSQKLFQKIWRCSKSEELHRTKIKSVRLKLPPDIAYNYNAFNKVVKLTSRSKVRVWMLDKSWWPYCFRQNSCYTRSSVKVSQDTYILPPFSRPYFRPYRKCTTWEWDIISILSSYHIPMCPYEEGKLLFNLLFGTTCAYIVI